MLSRITFSLVNDRGRYTHFVESCGRVVTMYDLNRVPEARVGIVCPADFPTDEQRYSIIRLAQFATGINPAAVIEFGEGTSPFPPIMPADHPLADLAAQH